MTETASWRSIRFDRNELSGAFGDIGTDLPLIVGIVLASGLDSASALILFGILQIATGLLYRMPMPVQPLKAMAALIITQKIAPHIIFGAALAIAVLMLVLTVTGLIEWLARVVPKSVVRCIQFGLGLQLATLAMRDYLPADKTAGWVLAFVAVAVILVLWGNRRIPAALIVIALGVTYAFAFRIGLADVSAAFGFRLPTLHVPVWNDVWQGLVLLALPQLPLSLGNSILATQQIATDLFPERPLTVRRIGLTYAGMNFVNAALGGIPTCHGSGGMAGHYTFGGRTGGSVILYGVLYLMLGLFLSRGFAHVVAVFPLPILGVLLVFEGLTLLLLVRDLADTPGAMAVAMLVGLVAVGVPNGYAIGLPVGLAIVYLSRLGFVAFGRS